MNIAKASQTSSYTPNDSYRAAEQAHIGQFETFE
jgi:hypothetical protein